jgi:hypothetical protein
MSLSGIGDCLRITPVDADQLLDRASANLPR